MAGFTTVRSSFAGIVVIAALAVAGCGSGSSSPATTTSSGNGEASKPAAQALSDAVNAAESASSLHMSGNVSSGATPIALDLSIAEGKGATGWVMLSGSKVELVIVGNAGYLKADSAFWTQFAGPDGPTIVRMLAGRWLKFPLDSPKFQPIVSFSRPNALFDSLKSSADSHLKNNGETMYKGQRVVALDAGATNGMLYVSATGKPYPVALVKGGSTGSAITFSDWNQSVSLTAPTDVLDVSHATG
jgi:hypothetical protein